MTASPGEKASLGEQFARAVAAKDHEAVRRLLHPQLDFRAMTPGRVWEATTPGDVIDALQHWFEDSDKIESVNRLECDGFADRERVGYRLVVRNDDGLNMVEQQAYLSERGGRIGWLRIMCSGFRPLE